MLVPCATAFVRAMVFSPPEEIVFLYYYRSGPNVPCLLDEDTTVLQFVDSENKLLVDLFQSATLVSIQEAFVLDQ